MSILMPLASVELTIDPLRKWLYESNLYIDEGGALGSLFPRISVEAKGGAGDIGSRGNTATIEARESRCRVGNRCIVFTDPLDDRG